MKRSELKQIIKEVIEESKTENKFKVVYANGDHKTYKLYGDLKKAKSVFMTPEDISTDNPVVDVYLIDKSGVKIIQESLDSEFKTEVMDLYEFYKTNSLDEKSPETQREIMTDYLWDTYDQDSLFNNELIDTLLTAIEYGDLQ